MDGRLPNLGDFRLHRVADGITSDGIDLAPLRGTYYRRDLGGREASVGVFSHLGADLFAAWGWADEPHCSFNAVKRDRDGWYPSRPGCPAIEPVERDGVVVGFRILTPEGMRTFGFRAAGPPGR